MAQRRIARALANFGQSLQNIANVEMQNRLIKERQAEESRLIGERQREQFERQQLAELTQGLREGKVLPQQLSDKERMGITGDPSGNILKFAPPEANVLAPIVTDLAKITKSGEVPTGGEIMSRRLASGQPIKDLAGIGNIIGQAENQRSRLLESEADARMHEIAQAGAQRQAEKLGENEAANIAQPDVERRAASMGDVSAKVAGKESYARESGAIKAKLDNASAILKTEIDAMKAKIPLEADKMRLQARVQASETALQAGMKALPQVTILLDKYRAAEKDMKQLAKVYGPAILDQYTAKTYWKLPVPVREYLQERDKSLPFFARLTGEVGNLAEQEQQRQLFGLPTFWDAAQNTGMNKLENAFALAAKAGKIAELNLDPNTINLDAGVRYKMLVDTIEEGKSQLRGQFNQGNNQDAERARLLRLLQQGR